VTAERPRPDIDRTREALREHDERIADEPEEDEAPAENEDEAPDED